MNIRKYILKLHKKIAKKTFELITRLKMQLEAKRRLINELKNALLESVNETNLMQQRFLDLENKYNKMNSKREKAQHIINQFVKRRDEFLKRLRANPPDGVTSFADYKFFLSESFIKDGYEVFEPQPQKIDEIERYKELIEENKN